MTPQRLFALGAAAAISGGVLRIAAAFIPYAPDSAVLEAFYAVIDLLLLSGVTAIYLRESGRIGWPGLTAFGVAFAGLASLVGPDKTAFGIDWYQAGAMAAALGTAGLGLTLIASRRAILASIAWVLAPIAAISNVGGDGMFAAGALFGLGFVFGGAGILMPSSRPA